MADILPAAHFPAVSAAPAVRVRAADPRVLRGLERAAGALGRLDEALDGHPLLAAFLYRIRLEAVQRQAAVDGDGIDRWHLAATLAGLPIRMHGLDGFDRGGVVDAARAALTHHQWLVDPDFDQEGVVREAEAFLAEGDSTASLLGLATRMHAWLEAGGARPPIRAALVRNWGRHCLLRVPVPITGPAALAAARRSIRRPGWPPSARPLRRRRRIIARFYAGSTGNGWPRGARQPAAGAPRMPGRRSTCWRRRR